MPTRLQLIASKLWPVALFVMAVIVPLEVYRSYKKFN